MASRVGRSLLPARRSSIGRRPSMRHRTSIVGTIMEKDEPDSSTCPAPAPVFELGQEDTAPDRTEEIRRVSLLQDKMDRFIPEMAIEGEGAAECVCAPEPPKMEDYLRDLKHKLNASVQNKMEARKRVEEMRYMHEQKLQAFEELEQKWKAQHDDIVARGERTKADNKEKTLYLERKLEEVEDNMETVMQDQANLDYETKQLNKMKCSGFDEERFKRLQKQLQGAVNESNEYRRQIDDAAVANTQLAARIQQQKMENDAFYQQTEAKKAQLARQNVDLTMARNENQNLKYMLSVLPGGNKCALKQIILNELSELQSLNNLLKEKLAKKDIKIETNQLRLFFLLVEIEGQFYRHPLDQWPQAC